MPRLRLGDTASGLTGGRPGSRPAMDRSNAPDAILVGGPRDGTLFTAEDTTIVELEIDGLIQRYLRTVRHHDHHGQDLVIFVYDGAGSREGTAPGTERL